jgi:hypothetical protein
VALPRELARKPECGDRRVHRRAMRYVVGEVRGCCLTCLATDAESVAEDSTAKDAPFMSETRNTIIAAASELFYSEGIARALSIGLETGPWIGVE